MCIAKKPEKHDKKIDKAITLLKISDIWLIIIIAVRLLVFVFSNEVPGEFTQTASALTPNPVSKGPAIVIFTPTPVPTFGLPLRLKIEKINLEANIQHLGLTPEGNLSAPNNMVDAGWFKDGVIPGEAGSAVIDGHRGVGEWGVFADLHKLEPGDLITIEDDKGNSIFFRVRETRIYKRDERPAEVFSDTKGANLNLITCDGEYERSRGGTPNRLVVFTDMVN